MNIRPAFLSLQLILPLAAVHAQTKTMPTPVPRAEMANSCLYTLKENAYVLVAVPYRSFDESKKSQKSGREVQTAKHATWLSCGQQEKDMVCTATIAVTRNESLLVAIGMAGGTETKARDALAPIGQEALKRMPTA